MLNFNFLTVKDPSREHWEYFEKFPLYENISYLTEVVDPNLLLITIYAYVYN